VLTQVTEASAKATRMQLPPNILSSPEAFCEFDDHHV
jgi:hypothetical protein